MTRILTPDDIKACRGHVVAIDTETTGLRWWENRIIGVGIHCPQVGVTGYMPTCTYREAPYGKPKRRKVWMGKMSYDKSKRGRRVLEEVVEQPTRSEAVPAPHLIAQALDAVDEIAKDGRTTLVGHNLKFDAHFLDLPLWQMPCTIVDTSVLVHLIDSRLPKSLEKAEEHFLGNTSKRQHVEVGKSEKKLMPWHWQPDHLAAYCTNDCVVTYQLAEILTPQVRSLGLLKLFSLEMAAIRLLQKIEFRGLLLDTAFCRQAIDARGSGWNARRSSPGAAAPPPSSA